MQIKKLLKWGSSSLAGHLVMLGIPFGVAEFVTGIYLNYVENTLTPAWAVHVAVVCAVGAIAGAMCFWYSITLPLTKRMKRKGQDAMNGSNPPYL